MTTIVEIDTSIDALTAALARGELKVRFSDGREVTYQSAADIGERLRLLRLERVREVSGMAAPSTTLRSWPIVMRR